MRFAAALALLFAVQFFAATAQAADDPAAILKGQQLYTYWCATCHGPDLPGTVALEAKYKGSKPALLDQRTDLLPPVTKTFVRKGVSVMPFFRKTEIGDADLDALAAYLARARK
jgi:mono/diheme cytochrome c family protein